MRGALVALALAACSSTTPIDTVQVEAPATRNTDGSLRAFPPAPADVPGATTVVPYDDFGPQAMSFDLIGMGWYTFSAANCCYEPGDAFDVRVVVARDATALAAARTRYPSGPTLGDYRFVTLADVRTYVAAGLADEAAGDRIPSIEASLRALAAHLDRAFGPA